MALGEEKAAEVTTRLKLRGDYDVWRREELRAELERLKLSGDIVIDFKDVTLLDAGSAAMLIALRHRLAERTPGARIILLNASRIVVRVLDICGASALFDFTANG